MIRKLLPILFFLGLLMACEDIFEVTDISNEQVELLAPLNGTTVTANTVNLNWMPVDEATSYQIQAVHPNFQEAEQVVLDSLIAFDSLGNASFVLSKTFENGPYAWRVRAMNSDFETAYTTAGFTVNGDEEIDTTAPNTPELTSPANGASLNDGDVTFIWTREDSPGTTERDSIYIFSDESLTSLSTKGLGANKSYTTTIGNDTYYWYVKAFDAAGNESDASETFSLTIQ